MRGYSLDDTIAAISTPPGEGGIGIVRLSGHDALKVAEKIFIAKDGTKSSKFKTYTTHYGWIVDGKTGKRENGKTKVIDEVILTVMRAPKSYTRQDIVEINCHGGIVALRAVLDLILGSGVRLAEPGEFTKRAFLNGRIDLTQAEAVLDIIRAKTDAALKIGTEQLRGVLSRKLNKIRLQLLEILSLLEANIDFPEEEIGSVDLTKVTGDLENVDRGIKDILSAANQGRIMREGINVVICGRPNVGKSSLLNALLKTERSIVTPQAGTTRDTIEEVIDIKGIPVKIVDTAGIIEPKDLVEKKAVRRSKKYINFADLIILLFDANKRLSKEDRMLIKRLKKKTSLCVINKIDLRQQIEKQELARHFSHQIEISAKRLRNIECLEQAIVDLVYSGKARSAEFILVSNLRHIEAIRASQKLIAEALNSLDNKLSLEFIAQNIKDTLLLIDEVLGRNFGYELLDKIFNDFCIGK